MHRVVTVSLAVVIASTMMTAKTSPSPTILITEVTPGEQGLVNPFSYSVLARERGSSVAFSVYIRADAAFLDNTWAVLLSEERSNLHIRLGAVRGSGPEDQYYFVIPGTLVDSTAFRLFHSADKEMGSRGWTFVLAKHMRH